MEGHRRSNRWSYRCVDFGHFPRRRNLSQRVRRLRRYLWDTSTWQRKGDPLLCGSELDFHQPGNKLGIATGSEDIQIWDLDRRERLAQFNGHRDFNDAGDVSLTWTGDGTRLLSVGTHSNPIIRSGDTSTWKQVGDPWSGHDEDEDINGHILAHVSWRRAVINILQDFLNM